MRRSAEARGAVARATGPLERGYHALKTAVEATRTLMAATLRPQGPLVDRSLERRRLSAPEPRVRFAAASAIHILEEGEAAFARLAVIKTALDLRVPQSSRSGSPS